MRKKQLLITIAIVLVCVLIDIALHAITSEFSSTPEGSEYGEMAEILGVEITATLWALLAFSGAAIVFFQLQNSIPGDRLEKGVRYGSAISLLWLFAMLEGVGLFGNELLNEFVIGLSDAIPALILGILLGLTTDKNNARSTLKRSTLNRKVLTVGVFASVFFVGRCVAYLSGSIQSGYQTNPSFTFLWTLLMGACIGIACLRLGDLGRNIDLKRRAVRFGIVFFGVNWTTFLLFMPFLFTGYLTDVLTRMALDVLLVTFSYIIAYGPWIKAGDEEKLNDPLENLT